MVGSDPMEELPNPSNDQPRSLLSQPQSPQVLPQTESQSQPAQSHVPSQSPSQSSPQLIQVSNNQPRQLQSHLEKLPAGNNSLSQDELQELQIQLQQSRQEQIEEQKIQLQQSCQELEKQPIKEQENEEIEPNEFSPLNQQSSKLNQPQQPEIKAQLIQSVSGEYTESHRKQQNINYYFHFEYDKRLTEFNNGSGSWEKLRQLELAFV